MKRNTITNLEALHAGDRFTYIGRVDPWQVVGRVKNKIFVNQFTAWGKQIHTYDEQKKPETQVRFLRHTQPLPGEDCQLYDLKSGDVFFFMDGPSSIVNEFEVLEVNLPNMNAQVRVRAVNTVTEFTHCDCVVCFVRKEVAP